MRLLPRASPSTQRRLTLLMQLLLFAIVVYGLFDRQPKAITNGAIGLGVTLLPAIIRRNYELSLDPWLGLWITTAVFLHTLGSAGLYAQFTWWDSVTHALSASLVAGAGYTAARVIDLHSKRIQIPRKFVFIYLFIVVLAFGVIWELFEFSLDLISAETGLTMPLAQHGLDDTVVDMLYNSLGALLVALFGQVHLTGVAESLRDWTWLPEA